MIFSLSACNVDFSPVVGNKFLSFWFSLKPGISTVPPCLMFTSLLAITTNVLPFKWRAYAIIWSFLLFFTLSGINEPLVVIENVNISKDQIALMKRNTLKITLPNSKLSFIKFGSSEEEFNELYSSTGYINVNILGRCDINSWNDSPQIRIVDYEIVKKSQYYF